MTKINILYYDIVKNNFLIIISLDLLYLNFTNTDYICYSRKIKYCIRYFVIIFILIVIKIYLKNNAYNSRF